MMPLLISGPKQPGNDIDVFLAPLIEELERLWKDGIRVYDAHKKEWCVIRVMIFCMVNDFPMYTIFLQFFSHTEQVCSPQIGHAL